MIIQVMVGGRTFREGDCVINRRNNYDLGLFNCDIGVIRRIDIFETMSTSHLKKVFWPLIFVGGKI